MGARLAVVAACLAAVVAVPASADTSSVRVTVTPANALLDAAFAIRVTGLSPGEQVTVRLTEPAYGGGSLSSKRRARADAGGVVDLPRSALLALVTSSGSSKPPGYPRFRRNVVVSVSASRVVASSRATRYVTAPSVTILDERLPEVGFYGEYFRPQTARRHTAVVLLGGSDGGLANGFAAGLLASHGYPVLSLAYFGEPGLPASLERIPLEYFQRAISWLGRQPAVDPHRIAVIGVSRGGEAALLIGATYPQFVRAVAAYVPSDTVFPSPTKPGVAAWTLSGTAVASHPIAVEKIGGPVFVVGGGDDQLWPSASYVSSIAKRMRLHHRADVTAMTYPHAGHGAGAIVPNIPTAPTIESRYGTLFLGGTPSADAAARADSWPKLLRFLDQIR